jgi:hypothetical protein
VPCNTVALVRAVIATEHTTELLAGPGPLKAFALSLVSVLGREPTLVQLQEGSYATLQLADLTIDVRPGGLTVTSRTRSRSEVAEITRKVVATATALAIPLAIQRTVGTLTARYGRLAIQSDVNQGAARVVKLKIPLRRS